MVRDQTTPFLLYTWQYHEVFTRFQFSREVCSEVTLFLSETFGTILLWDCLDPMFLCGKILNYNFNLFSRLRARAVIYFFSRELWLFGTLKSVHFVLVVKLIGMKWFGIVSNCRIGSDVAFPTPDTENCTFLFF